MEAAALGGSGGLGGHGDRGVDEERPEEGAADPDGDDVREGLPGRPHPRPAPHPVAEVLDAVQDLPDARHHVGVPVPDHLLPRGTEGHVQHRPVLRRVDVLPGKHCCHLRRSIAGPGASMDARHIYGNDPDHDSTRG